VAGSLNEPQKPEDSLPSLEELESLQREIVEAAPPPEPPPPSPTESVFPDSPLLPVDTPAAPKPPPDPEAPLSVKWAATDELRQQPPPKQPEMPPFAVPQRTKFPTQGFQQRRARRGAQTAPISSRQRYEQAVQAHRPVQAPEPPKIPEGEPLYGGLEGIEFPNPQQRPTQRPFAPATQPQQPFNFGNLQGPGDKTAEKLDKVVELLEKILEKVSPPGTIG